MLFLVLRQLLEELDAEFDIDRPEAQVHYSVLRIAFRINIIAIKAFYGHALYVREWLHAFLLAFDRVLVREPGSIHFLDCG